MIFRAKLIRDPLPGGGFDNIVIPLSSVSNGFRTIALYSARSFKLIVPPASRISFTICWAKAPLQWNQFEVRVHHLILIKNKLFYALKIAEAVHVTFGNKRLDKNFAPKTS